MKKTPAKTKSKPAAEPASVPAEQQLPKDRPTAAPGFVSFQMNADQIAALTLLLNFSKTSFQSLANNANLQGDTEKAKIYQERFEVSDIMLKTFQALAAIGEPGSKSVH